jgi:ABC-type nitrate/sulfonate/bicarbonate transport system permease component
MDQPRAAVIMRPPTFARARQMPRGVGYASLIAALLGLWQALHLLAGPDLLPGPEGVATRGVELAQAGTLQDDLLASAERLALGWFGGCMIGIPLGLAMAEVPLLRRVVEPYIHFFRFIPPIAFVSLALIWFGVGELSKIVLIVYTTSFTVTVATAAGALAVHREKLWAAEALGASPRQILWTVLLPATVPQIVTGMRLGMANAFKTIVAAEMIGARSGLGFLIWSSRGFLDFEAIFLGIACLALLGLVADLLLRLAARPLRHRFGALA